MKDILHEHDKQIVLHYLNEHPEFKKDYDLFEIDPKHPFQHSILTLVIAVAFLIKLDKINDRSSGIFLKNNSNNISSYFEAIDILFTAKVEVIN